RGDPGAERQRRRHELGRRLLLRRRRHGGRRLGEEHGEAAAAVGAPLARVAQARHQRRRRRHGHVLLLLLLLVRRRGVDGDEVVEDGECGLVGAGQHDVVVVLLLLPRGSGGLPEGVGDGDVGGGVHRDNGAGAGGGVVVLGGGGGGVAAGEVGGEEGVAGHDLVDVVAGDVEVGDGVEPPELDRRHVVRLRRLLLRACI
ncbi:Os07g0124725, partial [Oryza sativa Japonica Group]